MVWAALRWDTCLLARYYVACEMRLETSVDDHYTSLSIQETTTNSYEGHNFFFTAAGDESKKEVARIVMKKEQVRSH